MMGCVSISEIIHQKKKIMKYITILEANNTECPNVGTITSEEAETKFKVAVESHFDAEMLSYRFTEGDINNLTDCINAAPIDVFVKLDVLDEPQEYKVELSETWLY